MSSILYIIKMNVLYSGMKTAEHKLYFFEKLFIKCLKKINCKHYSLFMFAYLKLQGFQKFSTNSNLKYKSAKNKLQKKSISVAF